MGYGDQRFRHCILYDKNGNPIDSNNPINIDIIGAFIIDDYTTPNITYFGYADCGADTANAVWRIKIIDETGNYPRWKWADGNANFDNIFNDRVGLSYI